MSEPIRSSLSNDKAVSSKRLSNVSLFLYALPAIPLAALTLPLYSFIPIFYAEALGLSLAGIGFALFLVRLFDAINDPLIGWLSDRFRPTYGRRRVWFAIAIPILMLGVWKLFWPPIDATVLYVGLWTLVLSIGFTCAILPYTAWGAELQTNYSDRARLTSWREGLTLIGTLLAISVPFSIGWADPAQFHGFAALAVLIVVALPMFGAITLLTTSEPVEYTKSRVSFKAGIGHILKNRPFRRLIIAFFLNGFANSIAATLFLLYCAQRLGLEELRGAFIFTYFACGIIGVPFWAWLASRTSKHRTWCWAMVFAIVVFSPAPFLPEGSVVGFGVICVLSGLALGADLTQPAAIQADVIDIDTADSGEQRSGIYFALWSLATKLSLALAVVIALPALEYFGFSANVEQPSSTFGIILLGYMYGWGPIALKLPALALMWNFPLGREQVANLRQKITEHIE